MFALTRAIIGNKRARSLFILYAGSLVSDLRKIARSKSLMISTAFVDTLRAVEHHVCKRRLESRSNKDSAHTLMVYRDVMIRGRCASRDQTLGLLMSIVLFLSSCV